MASTGCPKYPSSYKSAYEVLDDEVQEHWSQIGPVTWEYGRFVFLRGFNCDEKELGVTNSWVRRIFLPKTTRDQIKSILLSTGPIDSQLFADAAKVGYLPGVKCNYKKVVDIKDDLSLMEWLQDNEIAWDIQDKVQKINYGIERKKLVEFKYGGGLRVVQPYEVGLTKDLNMLLRGYQEKGYSARGRATGWKLFSLPASGFVVVQCAPFTVRSDYYTLPPFWTKDVATFIP